VTDNREHPNDNRKGGVASVAGGGGQTSRHGSGAAVSPDSASQAADGMTTVKGFARYCGISISLAHQLVKSSEVPSYRLTGKTIRVKWSDIYAWLDSKRD
jgi:hypothetical protein